VRKVAPFDLFADMAIDQTLKRDCLAHWQPIVDFESETFGRRRRLSEVTQ
jgi:hypothetical protein